MAPEENELELKSARIVEPSTPLYPTVPSELEPATQSAGRPPQSGARSPKKRRLLVVVVAAVSTLTLLGGGSAAAYNMWYQNPDRVMANALTNLLQMDQIQQSTTVSSDVAVPMVLLPVELKEVTFESMTDKSHNSSMKLSADLELVGRPSDIDPGSSTVVAKKHKLRVSGEAVSMKDGALYYRFNDVSSAYAKLLEASGENDARLSTRATELLAEIDNTWVKTDSAEITKRNDQLSCVLDEIKDSKSDITTAIHGTYRQYEFLSVKENLPAKNGNLGYRVAIDRTKLGKFYDALKGRAEFKVLGGCIDYDQRSEPPLSLSQPEVKSPDASVDIWVSRWSHQLRGLSFESPNQDSDISSTRQIKFVVSSKFDYEQVATVDAPDDAVAVEQWQKSLEALGVELQTSSQPSDNQIQTEV